MKTVLSILLIAIVLGSPLSAQLAFPFAGAPVVVPDGDLVGVSDTRWINEPAYDGLQIRKVSVYLQFSGGWNGDLFVQLNHNGQHSVLLNRPGVSSTDSYGYGDAGFSITLADSVPRGDVHWYEATLAAVGVSLNGGPLTGTWAPDGRPYSQETAVDPAARTAMLSRFEGMEVNGNWTLLLADLSSGGQGQLVSWGLEVSVVPEPAELAMFFGLGLAGWVLWRRLLLFTGRDAPHQSGRIKPNQG